MESSFFFGGGGIGPCSFVIYYSTAADICFTVCIDSESISFVAYTLFGEYIPIVSTPDGSMTLIGED